MADSLYIKLMLAFVLVVLGVTALTAFLANRTASSGLSVYVSQGDEGAGNAHELSDLRGQGIVGLGSGGGNPEGEHDTDAQSEPSRDT